jgi:outer membrane cobalamin receptor
MSQDESGYDPWRKLCLHGYDDPWTYDQTRVIKKRAHGGSDRKASMAYSISPENSAPKTILKAAGSDESEHEFSIASISPSNDPDYDGMYEKALDEKLELEFDDDLELFETIENGIHGTADLDTSMMCNASYNRDINTWRQYSGVSMETISDDLWSDMSDTHSEDILNENFVIPLLAKAKQVAASATNTNYHWRTHIEP